MSNPHLIAITLVLIVMVRVLIICKISIQPLNKFLIICLLIKLINNLIYTPFKNQVILMIKFQAKVLVRLRSSVLDPAGEATKSAASRLGIDGISNLRIGKLIELELQANNEIDARKRLEVLSDRLLANPVIEDWSLELLPSKKI